eukprot:m51a1_g14654 hypothetical protein (1267) ;mRNA; f:132812-147619
MQQAPWLALMLHGLEEQKHGTSEAESLSTAWVLRQSVVPALSSTNDLLSLAEASRAGPRDLLIDALCAACATSSVEAMGVLAAAPYSLGHDDALRRGSSGKCAVDCACESDSVDALEDLAQPPFNVSRDDLLQSHLSGLRIACGAGRADIVSAFQCTMWGGKPHVLPQQVLPHAPPSTTVDVWWLEAPLMSQDALGLLQQKHVGIGFSVRENPALNWTVEYSAYWGFLNALVPHAEYVRGKCELTACNRGAVDSVAGIDLSRWSREWHLTSGMRVVGHLPAYKFNKWSSSWLADAVAHPHPYDLLQVHSRKGAHWLPMYTCQTFAEELLASLTDFGCEFACRTHSVVSDQVLISATRPTPVLPTEVPDVCDYYASFPKFGNVLESLMRVILHHNKYLYVNSTYYKFNPTFPFFEFRPRQLTAPGDERGESMKRTSARRSTRPTKRAKRAATTRRPPKPPVPEALSSAWTLRELVVPALSSTNDLLSLAEASRAASLEALALLAGPPYSLARHHALRPDAAGRCAVDSACESGSVAVLEALARPPFCVARDDLLRGHLSALQSACRSGSGVVVARLAEPPFSLGRDEALDCRALVHGAGSVAVLDVLAAPPWGLGSGQRIDWTSAFQAACRCPSGGPVRRLAQPPYSLERKYAVFRKWKALPLACSVGSLGVLDALAAPPYCLTRTESRWQALSALKNACAGGHCEAIRRLAQPPYSFDNDCIRGNMSDSLKVACGRGHVRVLEELARPPYNVGNTEAAESMSLVWACKEGRMAVVRALAQPPFCLGHREAGDRGNLALLCACMSGNAEVVQALSEPPYGLEFAMDDPESVAMALAAIEPACTDHERTLRERRKMAFIIPLRKLTHGRLNAAAVERSYGAIACAAFLQALLNAPPFIVAQLRGQTATVILEILSLLIRDAQCADRLPESFPGVVALCARTFPSAANRLRDLSCSVLARIARAPRMQQLLWQCGAVEVAHSVLQAPGAEFVRAAAELLGAMYALDGPALAAVDPGVRRSTLRAIAPVLQSPGTWSGDAGEAVLGDLLCVLLRLSVVASAPTPSGAPSAGAAEPPGSAASPSVPLLQSVCQCLAVAGRVVPAATVPLAMACADTATCAQARLLGLHVLCNATARAGGPGPADAGTESLYQRVRDWGFSAKVQAISAACPGEGHVARQTECLAALFERREDARVAQARSMSVCTASHVGSAHGEEVRAVRLPQWVACCRTCSASGEGTSVCEVCAAQCHQGHELGDWRFLLRRCTCSCAN